MNAARDLFIKMLSEAAESTKPKGYMGLLTDHSITLKNLLLSAVVVCLELLLSSEVFDCPMKDHTLYGTVFLLAPIVIIFVINVLVLSEVWKLTDRCCVPRYRRIGEFCYRVCPNVVKALIGPAVWLIASFADSTYYACATVGPDIEKRNLTNVTEIKELEAEFAHAKSKSHLWAWLVFVVVVIVTAVVMATKKCCLKDNVLLEDDYILERREAVAALLTFRHFIEHPNEHGDSPSTGAVAGSPDDEAKDEVKVITGRFMGKEEEIALYPDGIPEQRGKKQVEEFFKDWSKTDWRYEVAYENFQSLYPRVTSGRPKDEWKAKGDDDNECCTLISCTGH